MFDLDSLFKRYSWFGSASCSGHHELYDTAYTTHKALNLCRDCPVIEECLAYGMEVDEIEPTSSFMIYGGKTPIQRKMIRKERSYLAKQNRKKEL